MRIVILFCGSAGSGKDTSFNALKSILNNQDSSIHVSQFAFGNPLKEIVSDLCQLFLNEQYSPDEMNKFMYKEVARPEHTVYPDPANPAQSEPLVIRRLLQIIGTDCLRKRLGNDVFATAVLRDIDAFFESSSSSTSSCSFSQKGQRVRIACVTDLRFPNEQECIRNYCEERGFKCVTVYIRRMIGSPNSRTYAHNSESHYDQLEKDFVIENCGHIDELENEVKRLVSSILL